MKLKYLYEVILFVVLFALQAVLLSRVALFGYASLFLYVYFFLKLPLGRNPYYLIIAGFVMGTALDIFMNTPGMNAVATTIMATLRKPILDKLYVDEEYEDYVPNIKTDSVIFLKFTSLMLVIHHVILIGLDVFTLFNIVNTLIRLVSTYILTFSVIIAVDALLSNNTQRE